RKCLTLLSIQQFPLSAENRPHPFLEGKTLLKDDGVCDTYESNGEIFVVQQLESYLTDFETEVTEYSIYFSVLRGVLSIGSH
ncbi:MAG: hypothetical protein CO108_30470, partial [Deltaproteobacteria bacterium CG_4_9_14_3_um_filter_63_12]